MGRRKFIAQLGVGSLAICTAMPLSASALKGLESDRKSSLLKQGEIQHMVIFDLNHPKGSELAIQFLRDGRQILSNIAGVYNFQAFTQISLKNDFSYGFSMIFSSKADYTAYSNHPDHAAFVENRWKKEVSRFLEIDFESF
jgi:Stress responsive A/B Barrel Domain